MNIRTLAVPAAILLSGSMLAACGDPDDDLDPADPTVEQTADVGTEQTDTTIAPTMDAEVDVETDA